VLNAVYQRNLSDATKFRRVGGLPALAFGYQRVICEKEHGRPLPAMIFRLQREVNMCPFSTQVIRCGPYRLELETSLAVGLHPTLKAPRRQRSIVRAEIEPIAVSVICVDHDILGWRMSVGADNLPVNH